MDVRQSVILIPALHPDESLTDYVRELQEEGFCNIIIVDDGSGEQYEQIFARLSGMGCVVLRHAINYGKGRALKNGFNEFLNRFGRNEKICGIITADSDGQHLVKDVVRMDGRLAEAGGKRLLLLGVRNFKGQNVPLKSSFGNRLTGFLFRLLYGKKIQDTQTGLRGITTAALPDFLVLKGERFEYETAMLIQAVRKEIRIEEIPIQTVYLDRNKGTHFRPLQDSLFIYRILFGEFFRYLFSSLSASVIDIGLFHLLSLWIPGVSGIWIATGLARAVSSFYNYLINRNVVFEAKGDGKRSLRRYYVLCVVQAACSAWMVSLMTALLSVSKTLCKVIVDTVLFFVSFQVQRRIVFRETAMESRGNK